MLNFSGPYRGPATLMFVSAILHLAAMVMSGGSAVAAMVVGIVVYGVVGIGLLRGWRWFAYVGFLVTLIGGIVALATAAQGTSLLATIFWGIVVVDWLAAVWLLARLWRGAERAAG